RDRRDAAPHEDRRQGGIPQTLPLEIDPREYGPKRARRHVDAGERQLLGDVAVGEAANFAGDHDPQDQVAGRYEEEERPPPQDGVIRSPERCSLRGCRCRRRPASLTRRRAVIETKHDGKARIFPGPPGLVKYVLVRAPCYPAGDGNPAREGGDMKRQLHLNLFIHSRGHHEASWRHPMSSPLALTDIRYYQDLAQRAEAGLFDSIFLADQLALGDDVDQAARTWLEPVTVLAAVAGAARPVGMISPAAATHSPPVHPPRPV